MANVILPIASVCLTLGGTFNMFSYDIGKGNCNKSIFNDSDFIETPLDILDARYYIVKGDELPYSAVGLPIDLVRKIKGSDYNPSSDTMGVPTKILRNFGNPDEVVFLIVAEYRTAKRSVKENAMPISSWQEFVPKTQTHYVEAMHYGGRCIGMIKILSTVPGDAQVVLRLLTSIMGTSGPIGEDTIDMWGNARETALRWHRDIRGIIYFESFKTGCDNVNLDFGFFIGLEHMMMDMQNLKNLTSPYNKEDQLPIYVSFKPLRNLDDEYPAVEKKKKSKEYLVKLDRLMDDVQSTREKLRSFHRKFNDFENAARRVFRDFEKLVKEGGKNGGEISIYEDLNATKFDEAFKNYKAGLYKREHTYYSSFRLLYEGIGTECIESIPIFRKGTTGSLWTFGDEALDVEVGDGNETDAFAECKQHCLRNGRCRAVGFDWSVENHCRMFYRSTNTARIYYQEKWSEKVYDRECTVEYEPRDRS